MKKLTFLLASLIAISGCASMTTQEKYERGLAMESVPMKYGSSYAQYSRDSLNCEASAARNVPTKLSTYTTPAQTYCNRIGNQVFCNTVGGDTSTTDNNSDLRRRVYQQCIADKGWRFYDLPPCPKGTKLSDLVLGPNGGYPQATNRTCYLPSTEGDTFYSGNLR